MVLKKKAVVVAEGYVLFSRREFLVCAECKAALKLIEDHVACNHKAEIKKDSCQMFSDSELNNEAKSLVTSSQKQDIYRSKRRSGWRR